MSYDEHNSAISEDSAIPAFSPIIDDGASFLAGLPKPKKVDAGTLILGQNESPGVVRLVRKGIVKLTYTSREGEEVMLGLRSEGWWLGGTLALLNLPSLCAMSAMTVCSLSTFPVAEFTKEVMNNPLFLRNVLSSICRELLMVQQHRIMQGSSAAERLRYLQGESSQSIWKTIDPTLVMRQNEVAKLLSITPEHLSRITRKRPEDI